MMNRLFYDIETQEYINSDQLYDEYIANTDPTEPITFNQYIKNCLTGNGGTLEEVTPL